jgi:hypothetical protein
MFIFTHHGARLCDGHRRREFLRAGGISLFGLAVTGLAPQRRADAGPGLAATFGQARSCIVLFLMGGPPQHSTWDPKPESPPEIRGEFGPIDTAVPGVRIGSLWPHMAPLMDRVALLRAVSTADNAHSSSGYAMLTGQPHQPLNAENANPGFPNDWPTLGAMVQHLNRRPGLLPAAVRLPMHIFNTDQSVWPGQDAGFLGRASDPWLLRCEPASAASLTTQFDLPQEIPAARLGSRRALLEQLEDRLRDEESAAAPSFFGKTRTQAFELLSDVKARSACNLSLEPEAVRDRYGRSQFGQSVLLARRLVEAGVSLVHVNWFRGPDEPSDNPCWDSHTDETNRLKNVLVPPADRAFSALIEDLELRGLLSQTLVLCMAEFGRTPKFNPRGGRDHWGPVFSIALAGGGVQGGRVHGASDREGAYPAEGIVYPRDLTATVFHLLGYDPETEIRDPLGRTFPISRGRVVQEIL